MKEYSLSLNALVDSYTYNTIKINCQKSKQEPYNSY